MNKNPWIMAGLAMGALCSAVAAEPSGGVFVAEDVSGKLVASYTLTGPNVNPTNACADFVGPDGAAVKCYRMLVTGAEYAAGWDTVSPARKDAAKVAAEGERWDYEKWTEREKRMLKLLVQELNILRQKTGLTPRTKEQVVEALKAAQ